MPSTDVLNMLGVAVAVVVLLKLLKPLIYFYALLKSQYRYPEFKAVAVDDVPPDVRDYMLRGAEPMLALGFSLLGWARSSSIEYSEHGDAFALVLSDAQGVTAWVGTSQLGHGLRTNFYADFEDGSRIETAHGEADVLIGEFPNTEIIDTPSPEIAVLWQTFADRLAQLTEQRRVVHHTLESRAAAGQHAVARAIDHWIALGQMQPAREPGRFQFTWRRALQLAVRIGPALERHAKFRAQRAPLEPPVYPVSDQIRAYHKARESAERRSTRFGVGWVLLVSGVLFALSMWRIFDWRNVPGLIAAVMFHELGHYLAMRALGYQDTSIFFVPFLGAATRGVKRDEQIHEQLIVLLAGPVPGIVLGALLPRLFPALAHQPQFSSFVDLLIIINLLNLFPIFPLDGGRIVALIFNNVRPSIEVVIRSLGALALFALGLFASDPLTIALSILLALGVPAARRTAKAIRRIRARGPVPAHEDERLAMLFDELRTNQPSLPPAKRYAVILPLAQRLRHGQLSALGAFGWCSAYLSCVAGGLAVLALVTVGLPMSGKARVRPRSARAPLACGEIDAVSSEIDSGRAYFTLRCSLDDAARATTLASALEEYTRMPANACLRAPWEGVLGRDAQTLAVETRARRSVLALVRAEERALRESDANFDEGADLPDAELERLAQQRRIKVHAAMQACMQAHASDPEFDAQAATVYMQWLTADDNETLQHYTDPALAQLLDRLGRNADACSQEASFASTHALANRRHVEVGGVRSNVGPVVRDLARYLCARGCQLTYQVHSLNAARRAELSELTVQKPAH